MEADGVDNCRRVNYPGIMVIYALDTQRQEARWLRLGHMLIPFGMAGSAATNDDLAWIARNLRGITLCNQPALVERLRRSRPWN